jgi:hypothetical protein
MPRWRIFSRAWGAGNKYSRSARLGNRVSAARVQIDAGFLHEGQIVLALGYSFVLLRIVLRFVELRRARSGAIAVASDTRRASVCRGYDHLLSASTRMWIARMFGFNIAFPTSSPPSFLPCWAGSLLAVSYCAIQNWASIPSPHPWLSGSSSCYWDPRLWTLALT